jgi:hypothetical protein
MFLFSRLNHAQTDVYFVDAYRARFLCTNNFCTFVA